MAAKGYLDFAEEDYKFFSATYKDGYRQSTQGAIAQNICEKYLKHIIDKYMDPENEAENDEKERVLRTHSLKRLMRYMKDVMEIETPLHVKHAMNAIDGFYFSMRYPGDDSYFASPEDIENAHVAVEETRTFVLDLVEKADKILAENEDENHLRLKRTDEVAGKKEIKF